MIIRPRRLRRTATIREMVRETTLSVKDFICPLFVKHGQGAKDPILTMPGQYQFSVDTLVKEKIAVIDRPVNPASKSAFCLCVCHRGPVELSIKSKSKAYIEPVTL